MKKIFGRVLLKETNGGIANLVVAAFHQERDCVLEQPLQHLDHLGERLGSTLTDADGNFELDTTACEPAGGSARPNLCLAVFAPEDAVSAHHPAPQPPEKRLLHFSTVARHHAGAVEAYVIRILKTQLDHYGISSTTVPLGQRDEDTLLTHFVGSVGQMWTTQERVLSELKPQLSKQVERATALRETAKKKLAKFSAVPLKLRSHPLFVPAGTDPAAAQSNAVKAGMTRVSQYSKSVALRFTDTELSNLGVPTGTGDMDPTKLADLVTSSTGVDYVRRRSLDEACAKPEPTGPITIMSTPTTPSSPTTSTPATTTPPVTGTDLEAEVLARVLGQLQDLPVASEGLPGRPDTDVLQKELDALKLKGGPADAIAFHDFHVLQVAFKHVWTQAFDGDLRQKAEDLYHEYTRLYDDAGLEVPDFAAINDVSELQSFLTEIERSGWVAGTSVPKSATLPPGGVVVGPPPPIVGLPLPPAVLAAVPDVATVWHSLSLDQQRMTLQQAAIVTGPSSDADKDRAREIIRMIAAQPAGAGGRLGQLMLELGKAISEPYKFDVFAPDTYNFGVMITYRQKWEPIDYQAGDLVATIPLAPLEARKYSHRQVVKVSRAAKEIEKSMSSRSLQSSETSRAESEIMNRATTATNFKMTAKGSFNVGIGSIDASTEFGLDQRQDSMTAKKDFHEATLRAAEEYKLERSLEVDTTTTTETEDTSSGEISNPNNELTVTYLFYELQRRFRISEHLHRARPVLLVAQDVPAPHEIDEAWLVQYQWILSRVLLDDSLRPALDYLTSGFAGDEVAAYVIKARWEAQRSILTKLEAQVDAQIKMRDALRETLVQTAQKEDISKTFSMPTVLKVLTFGLAPDPGQTNADMLEADRKAAQTRLEYAQQALDEMQKKLSDASTTFEQATKDYTAALQNKYSRHVAIDQLRVHVKQNILYYMQAIWDHEPPDQRFFRLYNKTVKLPQPGSGIVFKTSPSTKTMIPNIKGKKVANVAVSWGPTINTTEVEMVEIADLDNPLGYKGNYIVFPLKKPTFLTTFMMNEFIDDYFGVRDPDEFGNYTVEELEDYIACVKQHEDTNPAEIEELETVLEQRLSEDRPTTDEVIVPTGQLFIEALPGSHALLEDFKLLHRLEDVRKVKAEVRHAEMENLRLAARLAKGEHEDPEIEKRILVDKGVSVVVGDT